MEKKNNRVLAFQKVAKTGNIGKKSPVAGDIDYVRYLSMQKVNKPILKQIVVSCPFLKQNTYRRIIISLELAVLDS